MNAAIMAGTKQRLMSVGLSAFAFPAAMVLAAIIPGVNAVYSGHGGPAWLIVPFAFPRALYILWRAIQAEPPESRGRMSRFAAASIVAYALVAYPGALAGCASIRESYGLRVEPLSFWGLLMSPFGWVVFV